MKSLALAIVVNLLLLSARGLVGGTQSTNLVGSPGNQSHQEEASRNHLINKTSDVVERGLL